VVGTVAQRHGRRSGGSKARTPTAGRTVAARHGAGRRRVAEQGGREAGGAVAPSREGGGRIAGGQGGLVAGSPAQQHGRRSGGRQRPAGRHLSREGVEPPSKVAGMALDLAVGSDCSGARLLWVGQWVEKKQP
jgi:hypothetical protein